MQLRTPRIYDRRVGVQAEVDARRSAGEQKRFIDRINPWFAVPAAIVTILGFSASDLFPGIKGSQRSVPQSMTEKDGRRSNDPNPLSAAAPGGLVQTCVDLARKAADDTAQGFLLSAERLQKLRSNLRCE